MAFTGRCKAPLQCSQQGHDIYDFRANNRYPGKEFIDQVTGFGYKGVEYSDQVEMANVAVKKVYFGAVDSLPTGMDPKDVDFPYNGYVGVGMEQKNTFFKSFLRDSPKNRGNIVIVQDTFNKPVTTNSSITYQKQSGKTYLQTDFTTEKIEECGEFREMIADNPEWQIKCDVSIGNLFLSTTIQFEPTKPTRLARETYHYIFKKSTCKNSEARELPSIQCKIAGFDLSVTPDDYIVKNTESKARHLTIEPMDDGMVKVIFGQEFFQKYCIKLSASTSGAFYMGFARNLVNILKSDIDPGDDDYEDEPVSTTTTIQGPEDGGGGEDDGGRSCEEQGEGLNGCSTILLSCYLYLILLLTVTF
ncbi:unnamed protein product [Bursaphelenchus okinawaensis]|uniref:Peptidase A1 domain-containing protein n=1 Tax=Bursaphelenchus okinawaensis TaxID=465554 RepID=A0A811KXV3_9BILA|nr:unnamed protein product [Bursaphelenchus okinawaensis]CAG9113467.1 unnamed protein product [Bursaphelenchus okinawaensis]